MRTWAPEEAEDWAALSDEGTELAEKRSEKAIRVDGHPEDLDDLDGSGKTADDSMGALKKKVGAVEAASFHAHEYPPRCVGAPCSDVVQQLKAGGVQEVVGALVVG